MADQPIIKLHDGNMMPQLGLGVWQASNEDAHRAVLKALEVGYRSIDTAAAYKNEEAIGRALQDTDVPREDIFVTTKLWNDDQQNVQQAMETSLKKLQLEQVDLYLMHWPCPEKDLLDETGVSPVVNQIELHPMLQQRTLHAWNAMHQIQTESWSPLAQGGEGVFDQDIIRQLAKKYGKTPAQIVIRWHLDSGLVVIPKSVTPERIAENFAVFDFRLEKTELSEITKLDSGKRLGPDPETFNG
ncbi:MAG: aldo/keto reductase [Pantoea sp.]|nr:aldo/keto reductase [Pantoea sp.]